MQSYILTDRSINIDDSENIKFHHVELDSNQATLMWYLALITSCDVSSEPHIHIERYKSYYKMALVQPCYEQHVFLENVFKSYLL
jgi:hypothetical protein